MPPLSTYPKLQNAISYAVPRRKILLHSIYAVLFDCFDIYRPTCVVPDNGVLLPPQKLSLTIIANETQPPTFWAFSSVPYMDRSTWNSYTSSTAPAATNYKATSCRYKNMIGLTKEDEIITHHFNNI
jgi:hypothetical protein